MTVQTLNFQAELEEIRQEIEEAISSVLSRADFILGEDVEAFEKELASYIGTPECIGVSSGSDALILSLKALGVSAGDEVILPTHTFVATAFAVTRLGATPRFVDSNDSDLLMDLSRVEESISSKTKAIIAVHLYGSCVDVDKLSSLSIPLVEDVAQACGAKHNDKRVGSFGKLGCFSFYPSKNLGAYGDGGAITCHDEAIANKLKAIRDYGRKETYLHTEEGYNARLDTLQAAILRVKLRYLDKWNSQRISNADFYKNNLNQNISIVEGNGVYHQFVIRVANRDELKDKLADSEIASGIHYPTPLHLQPCFSDLKHQVGDFPVAEKASKEILSLPVHPYLSMDELEKVVEQVNKLAKPL